MSDRSEAPMHRWATAFDEATRGARLAQVVWVGDSISELNWDALPMPWQVGNVFAGRAEPVQYRNATADLHSPNMRTEGRSLEAEEAGFGGRAVELAPGQTTSFDAAGEGVTILWLRRPGGGELTARWGDEQLATVSTDGAPGTEATSLARSGGTDSGEIELRASGGPVQVAGIYVHHRNLRSGVRIWPAVRSGNKSRWFREHRSWLIEPLAALAPDLVVIATGTNDDDYELEITELIRTAREHAPDADVALWLPPLNRRFTADRAAAGRAVAQREGCGLVDAAGDLGELPTTDGVHPTAFTVALCSAHAATVLGGPTTNGWWSALTESNRALAAGQRWGGEGGGSVEVELFLGLATLLGRARPDDPGASWVLALPPIPEVAMGIQGPALGMGPGGEEHPDTFLSRLEPGRFAVNGGRGALEVERLVIRVEGGGGASGATVSLGARRDDGGRTEIVAVDAGGAQLPLAAPPTGLEVPLPCALTGHLHPTVACSPSPDQLVWVPMPPLARAAVATRAWLEVLEPVAGARATAAVAGRGEPGYPGDVLGRTAAGAIDLGTARVVGAELPELVVVEAGVAWWVGVQIEGGTPDLTIAGAWTLRGGAGVQVVPDGVIPSADAVTGAVVAPASVGLATPAPDIATSLLGPAPAVLVSLDPAPADRLG